MATLLFSLLFPCDLATCIIFDNYINLDICMVLFNHNTQVIMKLSINSQ